MRVAVIDGARFPLADCDWVLRRACGCVQAVSSAASPSGQVYAANEAAALRQFLADIAPHKVVAEAVTRGYTVTLLPRSAALDGLLTPCTHQGGGA